ncbi:hypothetical protein [Sphingomonas sp.]|jgi:hypothetical protein|uniref:hypothetical protein n=1 Tax=Sphingomonas sp. TaxID=28214 RepID=UPI0017C781E1|nr:hypothetical protein [Sphingomonas sp.]MBA3512293.1 hypothetical protein [Sphingomonas sp.]
MGADFKEKTKKSFEKCWDKAAVAANTPDLFSKAPDHAPNRWEAEPIGNATVAVGETILVRIESGALIGRRGLSPVLTITKPTARLIDSMTQGCKIARAAVVAADPISGVLEVTVS